MQVSYAKIYREDAKSGRLKNRRKTVKPGQRRQKVYEVYHSFSLILDNYPLVEVPCRSSRACGVEGVGSAEGVSLGAVRESWARRRRALRLRS